MPWPQWLRRLLGSVGLGEDEAAAAPSGPRVSGRPTSSNRASSFHLWWQLPGLPGPLVRVAVTCEVLVEPAADALYFWALQASFSGGGAGHTGLQWLPSSSPVRRAVNWGGYGANGAELDGSVSPLPSIDGNPNTRAYDWVSGQPHRLVIERGSGPDRWEASVDGVLIRELYVPGDSLRDPVVWSEVFARCDDPSITVRWSGFEAMTEAGDLIVPDGLSVNYQSDADGGCANTNVEVDGVGVRQVTNVARSTSQGTVVPTKQ